MHEYNEEEQFNEADETETKYIHIYNLCIRIYFIIYIFVI